MIVIIIHHYHSLPEELVDLVEEEAVSKYAHKWYDFDWKVSRPHQNKQDMYHSDDQQYHESPLEMKEGYGDNDDGDDGDDGDDNEWWSMMVNDVNDGDNISLLLLLLSFHILMGLSSYMRRTQLINRRTNCTPSLLATSELKGNEIRLCRVSLGSKSSTVETFIPSI